MRVPFPVVLLSSLIVVAGTWWFGTRNADFMTPPPEVELAAIRSRVASSVPPADHPEDAVSAPAGTRAVEPPPAPEPKRPAVHPEDLSRPPTLDEFGDLGSKGAAHLVDLANLLESEGLFQRSLLAWERVLDSGGPDDSQANLAIAAIKRLRPTLPDWNTEPSTAIPVTLHAGTGQNTSQILTPILAETAIDLERASAGILKVTAKIATGRGDLTANGPPPVALWLSGAADSAHSTEVLSFTVESADTLPQELRKTVFQILRGYLAREIPRATPRALIDGTTPSEALNAYITRRSWHELGVRLNMPPEKDE